MAATLVVVFVVIAIFTAGGGMALARPDAYIIKESYVNGGADSGDAGDGSSPSGGGGHHWNLPTDSGDSSSLLTDDVTNPIPTLPGKDLGKPDHKPYIPNFPIDHIPHIPEVPIKGPGHGSCDFWSSNYGSWPDILSTMSTIASIFGKPASSMFPSSMTLLQALQNSNGDAYSSLLKQASASMLNAFAYKNFELSPEDVRAKFAAALTSPTAAAAQASEFARANLILK